MKINTLGLYLLPCVYAVILFVLFQNRCKNRVFDMVSKFVPDANMILDLGCGHCCTTSKLTSLGKTITHLDIVDKGVCVRPQLFDGKNIPFNDKTFDLGICAFVLHHTDTQLGLLKELKRTCKKILVFEDTPIHKTEWEYVKKHAISDWGSCLQCFKNADQWSDQFKQLGLSITKKHTLSRWNCPFSKTPYFYPVTKTVYLLEST